ncbi:hypothetical protein N7472_004643 [Penicillium cf. griseofulvum]|uniref:Cytokinin riboside 5'-monophosphate phosphoribohydrolase LOG n=1 Tax=Penicillium cf. griseofulvum TaxID=2972120 RepID=A0A9W9JM68_9EURO|nr:hypothetical protein N7472_004643 [Penicillium cf. griseofulvum]KAJ5442204.1 hypothetical protein N7445_005211 [Penicillium cf. griseofulvum]
MEKLSHTTLLVWPLEYPVICVYCGSSPGNTPEHLNAARAFARALHQHHARLVYGGGTTGIMGELARELVKLSGAEAVLGLIPSALLAYERVNTGMDRDPLTYGHFEVVPDMHTRKMRMVQTVQRGGQGSGFVALSGGFGTIEEVMEAATWQQLGIHDRGVCLLNIDGFWDGLVVWIEGVVVGKGFLSYEHWRAIGVKNEARDVLDWLRGWKSEDKLGLDWGEQGKE